MSTFTSTIYPSTSALTRHTLATIGFPARLHHKRVLRRVAERYQLLPRHIYECPKFGMMMPGNWLDEPSDLQTQARESILKQDGVADQFGLRHAMQRYFAGKNDSCWRHLRQHLAYNTVAWRLTILALLEEAWLLKG